MADAGLTWQRFQNAGDQLSSVIGPDLASAATLSPTHFIHRVTGNTSIKDINPPWPGFQGSIVLLPADASTFSTLTTGTTGTKILLASTGVQFKALELVYDGNTGWWPSY